MDDVSEWLSILPAPCRKINFFFPGETDFRRFGVSGPSGRGMVQIRVNIDALTDAERSDIKAFLSEINGKLRRD